MVKKTAVKASIQTITSRAVFVWFESSLDGAFPLGFTVETCSPSNPFKLVLHFQRFRRKEGNIQ